MSIWGQWGFQDAASPLIEELIYFHDYAIVVLVLIITMVIYRAVFLLGYKDTCRSLVEGQITETVWTVLPAIILVFLGLPSLRLLYLLDEVGEPGLTVKSIGHQWYWSYEYSDFLNINFDSYIVPREELEVGDFRLLEVDHRMVLPTLIDIRVLVGSADVIHSWTVPSLGVKADAIPGRLNQLRFYINRCGVYYGQCSEICGANHSFIPIVVEAVPVKDFINWVIAVADDE